MNNRIIEMAIKAGFNPVNCTGSNVLLFEKFAELIVQECINKVRSRQMFAIEDQHNTHHAFDLLVYDIESHFGVES